MVNLARAAIYFWLESISGQFEMGIESLGVDRGVVFTTESLISGKHVLMK